MADNGICSIEGCGKLQRSKGLCPAHYKRLWRHGSPTAGATSHGAPKRWLLAHIDYQGDRCLIWPFARTQNGYGLIHTDQGVQTASRFMCEAAIGPAPNGTYHAAHSCNNGHSGCVHPGHLSWKTPTENAADKIGHGTYHKGETHPSAKLTDEQVAHIRGMIGRCTQRSLARKFGVSQPLISMIQRGQTRTQIAL